MLEVHFLNVGHGDCTIIRHPSGRITMVDINNGDDIDDDSFSEIRSELGKPTKAGLGTPTYRSALPSPTYRSTGLGGLFNNPPAPALTPVPFGWPAPQPPLGGLLAAALAARPDKKKQLKEVGYGVPLTNPIEFFLKTFPNGSIHRYIQTHPDLDHMRGLAELVRHRIEIENFWDTQHNKQPNLVETDRQDWTVYQRLRVRNSSPRLPEACAWRYGPFLEP